MTKIKYSPNADYLRQRYSGKIALWNAAGVATLAFNAVAGIMAAPQGDTRLLLGSAIATGLFIGKSSLQQILFNQIRKTSSAPPDKIAGDIKEAAYTHRLKEPEIYILDDPHKKISALAGLSGLALSVAAGAYHSIDKGAFALTGKNNIMVSRSAYERLNHSERMAVLSHEWAHIKNHDGALHKNLAYLGKLAAFSMVAADGLMGSSFTLPSIGLWAAAAFCHARANQAKEYRADMEAQILHPDVDAHISSLRKVAHNFNINPNALLSDFSLSDTYQDFMGSHPPFNKRQAQKLVNERLFREDEEISLREEQAFEKLAL